MFIVINKYTYTHIFNILVKGYVNHVIIQNKTLYLFVFNFILCFHFSASPMSDNFLHCWPVQKHHE